MAGADYGELVLHGLDAVIGGKLIPARVNSVLDILLSFDLSYTLHLPYELNLLHPETLSLYTDVFLSAIELAKMAGIKVIVFHAGISKRDDCDLFNAEIDRVRLLAKEAGDIMLAMENPVILTDKVFSAGLSAQNMTTFCQKVNITNVKLTFDVGHYFLRVGANTEALLSGLKLALPYIGHVHLHDNMGYPFPMKEYDYNHRIACGAADLHLPLGWGKIPIEEVLNDLSGFSGIINLEIEKRFSDQYENSLKFVRQKLCRYSP
jgi:sugar phosphate isomerase/epimerase